MTTTDAVTLLLKWFPVLKERVDDSNDQFEMPHVTYGLLATEILDHSSDQVLFTKVGQFIDELANSGDDLLEELLVVDVLEGIAQDTDVATKMRLKIGPKAADLLGRVEREFFGRRH